MFPFRSLPRLTPRGWMSRSDSCSPLQRPVARFAPGYYYTEAVTPPQYDPNVLFTALRSAARNEQVVVRNLRALEGTIALLRRRGIRVVLLRLPHGAGYTAQRPSIVTARWLELQRFLSARRQSDQGLYLVDWGDHPGFTRGDFCDNHHLNVFGANKLARLLDGNLRILCRLARNPSEVVAEVSQSRGEAR